MCLHCTAGLCFLLFQKFLPPATKLQQGNISQESVSHPVHGGGGWFAWQGGMRGRGACMAVGICMAGGIHGREACVAGGHAWKGSMHGRGHVWQGACMAGGMHGKGCAWWGACMAGGMCGRGHAWQGVCMAGMYGGGMCGRGGMCGMHAPLILRDTVNERAVCILLECILVHYEVTKDSIKLLSNLYSFKHISSWTVLDPSDSGPVKRWRKSTPF